MLTILQVAACPFPSPQGSQVYIGGMCKALARRGHRVILACYGHGVGEVDPELELLRAPNWPGYAGMRAGPDRVKPALDLAMMLQLARLKVPIDLIHAHNYEAPVVASLARWRRGVPLLYNNHNTLEEELHLYFQRPLARALARRLGRLADQQVPRRCDAALAISEQALPILRGLGCEQVAHVPPGLDPQDLAGADAERARARWDLGPGPWVVYAGNPDAYQDLDLLVDAMLRLYERLGARAPGMLLVSASPTEALQARAAALPDTHKRFVRTGDWGEVKDLLAAADIAALPRTRCSGYPIKLLNYLGLGLPTVAVRGAAPALPGVSLVQGADVGAFADALAALHADPTRRRAEGQAARAAVLETCTWDARARALEDVYARLLSSPPGAQARVRMRW